ncbi:hypothetical protein CF326_g6517 [Tilletia indica]|nr:hypothetical protein CF326_g6517 [Tilletia indica]
MVEEEVASMAAATRRSNTTTEALETARVSVHRSMQTRYGRALFDRYLVSPVRVSDDRLHPEPGAQFSVTSDSIDDASQPAQILPEDTWPHRVTSEVNNECLADYREGTNISLAATCAVCSRRTFTKDILFTIRDLRCTRVRSDSLPLEILEITDPHILERPGNHFKFQDSSLDNLALDPAGIHFHESHTEIDICDDCKSPLSKSPPKLPALSLANGNIRGYLPEHLRDCTWLEERLCARYLASACIVRLYDLTAPGAPEQRQRVMKGHACSFPLNTVATATKLPWAFGDGGPLVSCLWIGPRKPLRSDLRNVFKVRREKVHQLLEYLSKNFKDFPPFTIDPVALNSLPDDDVPELLMRHVAFQSSGSVPSLFDAETAGLEPHPALVPFDDEDIDPGRTYLENHGMIDVNGIGVPAHQRTASALANATGTERPDLVIRHGSALISDYNNPDLFPGMFPLLFPWGIGGFETKREVPLSLGRQATYLLDLADSAFRRHWSFIFIVANIKQRRIIHTSSRLACKSRDFPRVAKTLEGLDADIVKRVAEHLQAGGSLQSLIGEERQIFTLLKKCELLSVRVPGSKAVMNRARSEIRSYVGEFGIFQLFLTLNPHPEYSPIFQVFCGDEAIDLGTRAPLTSSLSSRLVQVAQDPVAAADYFHFAVAATFQFLFGWDVRAKKSSAKGGILGRLAGFFMVKEHTMRGQLHGHVLLWLEGGINPGDLRQKLGRDSDFQQRYLGFLDDLIYHHLPPKVPGSCNDAVNAESTTQELNTSTAREEVAPDPADPKYSELFQEDHRRLGEILQRHKCRATCFKNGRSSCRFLFPHDINQDTSYDPETRSINMRVQDSTVNWHNPTLLVATRYNHDLKCVQSGKSSAAAAAYITNYATKSEETPANQVSMINTVYRRLLEYGDLSIEAKTLLTKCVMQFGRERQLHAQQVATYVRDLGDTMQSHKTVPMLSGSLVAKVIKLYGPPRTEASSSPPQLQDPQSAILQSALPGSSLNTSVPLPTPSIDPVSHEDPDGASGSDGSDEDDNEKLALSAAGIAHQVDDYFHRGPTLDDVCFYEFVKYVELIRKPKHPNSTHHPLRSTHPNEKTHCHRHTPLRPSGIPRAIFRSFPRPDGSERHGDAYCVAMLAHFIPFSISRPLRTPNHTYEDLFATVPFPPFAVQTMSNWQALTECDDARDSDQLSRRKQEAARSAKHDSDETFQCQGDAADDADADVNAASLKASSSRKSIETLAFLNTLNNCGWFDSGGSQVSTPILENTHMCPPFTTSRRRQWTREQTRLEAAQKAEASVPKASTGVLAKDLGLEEIRNAPATTTADATDFEESARADIEPDTIRMVWKTLPPHTLIQALIDERCLNPSQALSFKIVARHFFETHYGELEDLRLFISATNSQFSLTGQISTPLRMVMHGEAGTGKTVVVRLFRELLDRFGKGKEIMFLAPTGKAACAIGGVTQHSAFALDIHRRGLANEELLHSETSNSSRRLQYLQDTFKGITWLFFDEVSMTSCEVMAEIDSALRIGTQRADIPFGGINVIFAGDLCQLPPVASSPLYTQESSRFQHAETRTTVELGRAAWLELNCAVEFREQMRMQDAEMAATLTRLRIRASSPADVDLLNDRVLPTTQDGSPHNATGLAAAIALARTNETVRVLNLRKAAAQAQSSSNTLMISNAHDKSTAPLSENDRRALLSYNGSAKTRGAIGRVPLYLGMPVVYRGKNQSVTLGVTNGAFATVAGWDLCIDQWGYTIPRGIVLKFSDQAQWTLSGLEPGCLPVQTATTTFNYNKDNETLAVQHITRKQVPIQPGFAMTIHSAQGITAETGVIVDLRGGGFEAYVAASRATRREAVFLLAKVTLSELNSPSLPRPLVAELERLNKLAEHTQAKHDHDRWRLDDVLKRRAENTEASSRLTPKRRNVGHGLHVSV